MLRLIPGNQLVIRPPDDLVQKNPYLETMSHQLADKYVRGEIVTDDDLENMGRKLWEALDIQTEFDIACRKAGAAILPVIIETAAADVQALPWETLHHPEHRFLGRHLQFTLTRRIMVDSKAQARLEKGPLRVLLFTSLPEDVNPETGRLNVEKEQERVQEALLSWIQKGLVVLEMPDDGRFSTLQDLLKNFRPHVLFLSGHGQFHNMPHANEAYGSFLFENEAGNKEAIREGQIANALTGTSLQAVILSACESGQAASYTLSSGLMRSISAQGIPHVIGMRESLIDEAGILFAQTLCAALAGRERIDFALQAARIAIQTPLKDIADDERSLGQWCLPMLISSQPDTPLIDWHFHAKAMDTAHGVRSMIGEVPLPEHFVGRRAELRHFKNGLFKGNYHKLLITGPGGQGKTSLAGKLASDLQKRGWQVFAWSTKQDKSWSSFETGMAQTLNGSRLQHFTHFLFKPEEEYERARLLLDLLMEQFSERVVVLLDDLESIQDPDTQALTDRAIAAWVKAARERQNLILLATSRWKLPDWDGEHLMLTKTNYGDFLQMAQGFGLPAIMLERRKWLRHVHEALGGNSRGLEFFAAAVQNLQNPDEEPVLLQSLAKTKAELQRNMAIAEIYRRLPPAAQKLLGRLPVYYEPVPLEGFMTLGNDLPNVHVLLQRLLGVSLLEASNVQHRNLIQYQCNPLVRDWLDAKKLSDANPAWLEIAAKYYFSFFLQERRSLSRAIVAYHALQRAGYHDKADSLALKEIVGRLTVAGSYTTLLKEWLPPIYQSHDEQARGKALAHTGFLLKNIGNYKAALKYLDQALKIQRKILDQAGEATTLNYVATAHQRQGKYETALKYLKQALAIRRRIQDKNGEAVVLSNIAQIDQAQGAYQTAFKNLEKVLEIQKHIGDQNQGTTLNNISQILKVWGNYDTALKYLTQALDIQQHIGDKRGESVTLNNISGVYQRRNDYKTALQYLNQALAIQRQIGDKPGEGITLNNFSGIYSRQGEFHTALEYLGQAWTIQEQIGDKAGQGMTLNNFGSVYQARGEYETALSNYRQALDIGRALGDQAGEAQTLNNIGTVLQSQGNHEAAWKNFEQALTIVQAIGSKTGESITLNNIGTILQAQGKYQAALENFKHTLILTQQIGDQIGEGATLNNIATVHEAQGNHEAALATHNQALAIRRKIDDREGEAQSLNNLSIIYRSQGDYATALDYLKLAGIIQEQIGSRAGLCITFLNQGHVHRQKGNIEDAIDAWSNAYQLASEMGLVSVLQILAKLGPGVGLRDGLKDWEARAPKKKSQDEK